MGRRLAYAELAANFLIDLIAVRRRSRTFRPLMTNFYLTKGCNLRCRYCYPPGDEPSLPVGEAVALLDKIRPHNPALNITGGEPLLYRGISQVLRRARELGFRPLLLSTNGLLLDRIENDLDAVDHVVISLDSPHAQINDMMCGVPGATGAVLANICHAAELSRRHGFALSLHAVVAPETIDGIEQILDLCGELGAELSVSPEHGRFDPHPGLRGHPAYRALLDRLITAKERGSPLFCSPSYLRAIRDFIPHQCFPLVSPRVEPDGRVYLPCQRTRQRHVYLQDYPSLVELMQREAEWITDPACGERCFLACYLEVERYLQQPLAVLENISLRHMLLSPQGARARAARPGPTIGPAAPFAAPQSVANGAKGRR